MLFIDVAETVAKVTSGAVDEEQGDGSQSVLRRKSSALLADVDKRYAGRTVGACLATRVLVPLIVRSYMLAITWYRLTCKYTSSTVIASTPAAL